MRSFTRQFQLVFRESEVLLWTVRLRWKIVLTGAMQMQMDNHGRLVTEMKMIKHPSRRTVKRGGASNTE
jgi:ATP:corrinoid adenosyltransferase